MKKLISIIGACIFLGIILISVLKSNELLILKTSLNDSKLYVEDITLISNGSEIYMPTQIAFKNLTTKNITNVKFNIKKGDTFIVDAFIQMDGMDMYYFDTDTHFKNIGFRKRDQLVIEIEYLIDGVEMKLTQSLNVSDYID